jgi:archaellum biogenesis ATPase FlaH
VGIVQFYFRYDNRTNQTAENVVRSFLQQLLYQFDVVPPSVSKAYEQSMKYGSKANPQYVELLTNCLEEFARVFILIDALDECIDNDRQELLRIVENLQQVLESQVKLFITTRSHHYQKDLIHKKSLQEAGVLEIEADTEDIKKYLKKKLENAPRAENLTQEMRDNIMTTISSKAKGLYNPIYPGFSKF